MMNARKPPSKDGADRGAGVPAPSEHRADRPSGRVQFDDRGNAVWEWSVTTGSFGREAPTQPLRRLEHPGLSIVEDAPPAAAIRSNPKGVRGGYDPYDSGDLEKTARTRRKDLRKLSEWIELKRLAEQNKKDAGE
ncbi:MAG: hypothetical protein KGL34_07175 [Gammaproteobacteria bacterium]|nr:hypothetical protein [Gammaproteobacteria bacterium]